MRKAAVVNLKGGCGKTTTVLAMWNILTERQGKSVLLVDNDHQGNLSRTLGVYQKGNPGTVEMLQTGKPGTITSLRSAGAKSGIMDCNLWMMAAADQAGSRGIENRYREALRELEEEYEYCLIDNPPGIGINVINALVAADEVIIPVNLDNWSLDGLEELKRQLEELKKIATWERMAVLVTDFEKTPHQEAAMTWLRDYSGMKVFNTVIRHSRKTKDSTIFRLPVTQYSPRSGTATDYRKFIKEWEEEE